MLKALIAVDDEDARGWDDTCAAKNKSTEDHVMQGEVSALLSKSVKEIQTWIL